VRLILFGERSLRYVPNEYIPHYSTERPHQGKGNMVLMPSPPHHGEGQGPIRCRERLGGLLKYYSQEAA
jgi:putative transposase